MNFALVGQNNFNDLPIETQIETYKWQKWLEADPNYVPNEGLTGEDIIGLIAFIAVILWVCFSKKKW